MVRCTYVRQMPAFDGIKKVGDPRSRRDCSTDLVNILVTAIEMNKRMGNGKM